MTVTDLALVACQEGIPFNSREGFDAFNETLPWPFLARPAFAGDSLYGFCAAIPPALPFEGFHDPIVSDIPTLVVWGSNDTQTSMKDAKRAAETLTRSQVVGFPEAGHGAIIFSKCARDVGLAFIERPEEPVNAACTDGAEARIRATARVTAAGDGRACRSAARHRCGDRRPRSGSDA